ATVRPPRADGVANHVARRELEVARGATRAARHPGGRRADGASGPGWTSTRSRSQPARGIVSDADRGRPNATAGNLAFTGVAQHRYAQTGGCSAVSGGSSPKHHIDPAHHEGELLGGQSSDTFTQALPTQRHDLRRVRNGVFGKAGEFRGQGSPDVFRVR